MPSPRTAAAASGRRSEEKSKRSTSFHGKLIPPESKEPVANTLRRPKTQPELLIRRQQGGVLAPAEMRPIDPATRRPTKLLLNVTIHRSLGHIHVIVSPESTVEELICEVLKQYAKEGRSPPLPSDDPSAFCLHYSQFSLESLDPKAKLFGLGSRNFFLCPTALRPPMTACNACSGESEKEPKTTTTSTWLKIIDFLR